MTRLVLVFSGHFSSKSNDCVWPNCVMQPTTQAALLHILMLPDWYQGYDPSTPTNSTFEHFFPSSQSYSSRGQTITPSHHITARENKATRVKASHTDIYLPTPCSSLDSPKSLPSSGVHGPKAILSPHLAVNHNNPVSVKDVKIVPPPVF